MKKLAIIGLLSLGAAGAYAQGTMVFNNNAAGTIVTHIYSPSPATPLVAVTGNGAGDFPASTTVYTGTLIGGSTGATGSYANGNNFTVQIYALGEDDPSDTDPVNGTGALNALYNGKNTLFSSLQPVAQYITTMSTSAGIGAGFIQPVIISGDPGIPNSGYNAVNSTIDNVAAVSLVCWYNAGGTISLATAIADSYPWGHSAVFADNNLGEPSSVTQAYNGTGGTSPGNMTKLTSFSLTGTLPTGTVPEPSTIALCVMGAGAFIARFRKK